MSRYGIFGGTFNPIHQGHLNSITTVYKKMKLDKLYVVTNSQNPLRAQIDGPEPFERLEMVSLALSGIKLNLEASDLEVERGGLSYTSDTINELKKIDTQGEYFLVIGADQLASLPRWHEYEEILSIASVVVTSRPGEILPEELAELPIELQSLVEKFNKKEIKLKTGQSIYLIELKDVDVSASIIRKKLRSGELVEKLLPKEVENYIGKKGLYRPLTEVVSDFKRMTLFCAQVLSDKKGFDLIAKDLSEQQKPMEYSLICSGTSRKHASSMADLLIKAVKENFGTYPQHLEGQAEGHWIVVDYGALMVHIFYDFTRIEYKLEEIWKDAEDIELNLK